MDFDRRRFVRGAGAALGALGCTAIVRAQGLRDGRTPITRAEWDEMVRVSEGQFACEQTPPATEGPFYYESSLARSALAEGRPGEPLRLGITLGGIDPMGSCAPLRGAVIDIWQTDTAGLYSNVGADLQPVDTTGQTFLRGHQITDDNGYVEFDTIVPGWEIIAAAPPIGVTRRTTHIHVKVWRARDVLTTQLYFPDGLIDDLYANREPYKSHVMLTAPGLDRAWPRIRNAEDLFFVTSGMSPMAVERVNGVLTAKATIGVVGIERRNFPTLFR